MHLALAGTRYYFYYYAMQGGAGQLLSGKFEWVGDPGGPPEGSGLTPSQHRTYYRAFNRVCHKLISFGTGLIWYPCSMFTQVTQCWLQCCISTVVACHCNANDATPTVDMFTPVPPCGRAVSSSCVAQVKLHYLWHWILYHTNAGRSCNVITVLLKNWLTEDRSNRIVCYHTCPNQRMSARRVL